MVTCFNFPRTAERLKLFFCIVSFIINIILVVMFIRHTCREVSIQDLRIRHSLTVMNLLDSNRSTHERRILGLATNEFSFGTYYLNENGKPVRHGPTYFYKMADILTNHKPNTYEWRYNVDIFSRGKKIKSCVEEGYAWSIAMRDPPLPDEE